MRDNGFTVTVPYVPCCTVMFPTGTGNGAKWFNAPQHHQHPPALPCVGLMPADSIQHPHQPLMRKNLIWLMGELCNFFFLEYCRLKMSKKKVHNQWEWKFDEPALFISVEISLVWKFFYIFLPSRHHFGPIDIQPRAPTLVPLIYIIYRQGISIADQTRS